MALNPATFNLPLEDREPLSISPKSLMLIAFPKVGKSTILGALSRNYNGLVMNFEKGGYDKIKCKDVFIETLDDIRLVAQKANAYSKANGGKKPYKFVIWDTMTAYQELCEEQATLDYMETPQGKNFNRWTKELIAKEPALAKTWKAVEGELLPKKLWKPVSTVTSGNYNVGSQYIRNAFKRYLELSSYIADTVIYVCHLRDKVLGSEDEGKTKKLKATSLSGQISNILAEKCDACCFMEREDIDEKICCVMDFSSANDIGGSRYNYLEGQKIVISEKVGEDENKEAIINTYWENIFIDLKQQTSI